MILNSLINFSVMPLFTDMHPLPHPNKNSCFKLAIPITPQICHLFPVYIMSDLSWTCHENPFVRFFVMLLKCTPPNTTHPHPRTHAYQNETQNDLEHLQFFSSLCHFLRILKIAYGLSGPKLWIFNRVFSHGIGFSLHIAWLIIVIWLTPLCYVRLQGPVSI